MTRSPSRPNILFILTDDQGCWAMGCAGNSEIRTPNLDRLAATGMRFDNFFCASPVCSPARASILTGRIPSQHGVHDWIRAGNARSDHEYEGRLIQYLKGQTGYPDILAQNGYTCGISGKWHLGDAHHPQMSFDYWEVHAKGGGPYHNWPMIKNGEEVQEPGYVTDVTTDNAIRFLEQQKGSDKPFYLSVHYTAPHSPWDRGNHPKDLYDEYHDNCPFESVPDVPLHPWIVSSLGPAGRIQSARAALSGYYAAVTAMDANVGRLLDWLEIHNLRENTLIVFTSDNGMNMGHHGIWGKGNGTFPLNMYDTSVKVPTLMSRPGHLPENVVCEELLSHYDIMPSLLDYVDMENVEAERLPGRSFAPLFEGQSIEGRNNVVVYDEYGPVRMIRTRTTKYVHRYPFGPHELYDLANDPDEEHNLVRDPAYAEQVQELRLRLGEWFLKYVNPLLDGSKEPVTGKGQLGLAGPAGRGEKSFADNVETSPDRTNWPWPFE